MKTVLITGGGGRMGLCIAESFKDGDYNVIITSRRADVERGIKSLDIRDVDDCIEATKNVDVIIHLAYYMKNDGFRENQVPTNVIGTWNLYEAAVKNKVKRVIFCSSNHVMGFYKKTDKLTENTIPRPDSPYALTKCFSELCGRFFSDRCGVSVINVRIGAFITDYNGLPYSEHRCKIWLSYRDTQQLFRKCVEADDKIKFLTIYGVSNNSNGYFDISDLKDKIGYEPKDNGALYLDSALQIDKFKGKDNNIFLGGDNPLRSPWTGDIVDENEEILIKSHSLD